MKLVLKSIIGQNWIFGKWRFWGVGNFENLFPVLVLGIEIKTLVTWVRSEEIHSPRGAPRLGLHFVNIVAKFVWG